MWSLRIQLQNSLTVKAALEVQISLFLFLSFAHLLDQCKLAANIDTAA